MSQKQDVTLIIGPAWVGDMVMAHSLFQCLAQTGETLDVLAPNWCLALLSRMPEVRRAIAMTVGHGQLGLGKRWQLAQRLKAERYTRSIVLPTSLKSALIPWFAGIPQRIGWLGEQRYGLLTDHRNLNQSAYPMMVQRFMEFAHTKDEHWNINDYPLPKLTSSDQQKDAVCDAHGLNRSGAPILALCPGAAWGRSKQWPNHQHSALARSFLEKGWQVWLLGGPNDAAEIQTIFDTAGPHDRLIKLGSDVPLIDKVDLLAMADVAVTNDSGLMHVAAAVNCKVVGLYGATSPHHTPPLCEHHHIFNLELPCQPCFKPQCQFGHLNCLNQITPMAVEEAILALHGVKA